MGWLLKFLTTASALEIVLAAVGALVGLVVAIKICEMIPWRLMFAIVLGCLVFGLVITTPREIAIARGVVIPVVSSVPRDLDLFVGVLIIVAGVIMMLGAPPLKR